MNPRIISEDEFAEMTTRVSPDGVKKHTGHGAGGGGAVTERPAKGTPVKSGARTSRATKFFLVHGEAIGKPRMTQRDKWLKRPVVQRYWDWCALVRFSAGLTEPMTLTFPTTLTLRIFLACPASWSRTKRLSYNGEPHTGKPDLDNVAKGIEDALFTNDEFVYKVEMGKWWTEAHPHVAVTIEEERHE